MSAADPSSPEGPGASDGTALQPVHATRMTLELGDIVLRPWCEADAAVLHAACQDAEIARWVSIPQPYALGDARAFIAESELMWRDGSGAAFAIVDAASGRLAGAVTRFGPDGHVATLGCWLAREARGRGIGWRALRAVADWTFRSTHVIRLDSWMPWNAALRWNWRPSPVMASSQRRGPSTRSVRTEIRLMLSPADTRDSSVWGDAETPTAAQDGVWTTQRMEET